MSLLSDEEIHAAIKGAKQVGHEYAGWVKDQRIAWGRAIEAAILAKLASAELPEPLQRDHTEHGVDYYTAAQLHEAHAQGFAAGAASQLSVEPVAFTDEDFMHIFVSADIAQDCGATIELYTRREAK